MNRATLLFSAACSLTCLFASGSAQAFTILSAARSVTIAYEVYDPILGGYVPHSETSSAPSSYGSWYGNLSNFFYASAAQTSLIDTAQFSNSSSLWANVFGDSADSRYKVNFAVTQTIPYTLLINQFSSDPVYGQVGPRASFDLDLVDPNDSTVILAHILSYSLLPVYPNPDISAEGILEPGTYVLKFDVRYIGSSFFHFPGHTGFTLTAIPEADSFTLVAMGIAALAAAQRRSRTLRPFEVGPGEVPADLLARLGEKAHQSPTMAANS